MKKKIILTGAESSGKTTLAILLAEHFAVDLVLEYAREFIFNLDRDYVLNDLYTIFEQQISEENKTFKNSNISIICDTDVLTIYLWAKIKYEIDSKILYQNFVDNLKDKIYLLCEPDLPWEYDIQRENPKDTYMIHRHYIEILKNNNAQFVVINGQGEQRFLNAIHHLKTYKCID